MPSEGDQHNTCVFIRALMTRRHLLPALRRNTSSLGRKIRSRNGCRSTMMRVPPEGAQEQDEATPDNFSILVLGLLLLITRAPGSLKLTSIQLNASRAPFCRLHKKFWAQSAVDFQITKNLVVRGLRILVSDGMNE